MQKNLFLNCPDKQKENPKKDFIKTSFEPKIFINNNVSLRQFFCKEIVFHEFFLLIDTLKETLEISLGFFFVKVNQS